MTLWQGKNTIRGAEFHG